jgi:hypothetical protein
MAELDADMQLELGEDLGAELAELAEAVRIGPVPTAAVMAAGRRRKARRRTVALALGLAFLLPAGGLTVSAATSDPPEWASRPAGPGVFKPVTVSLGPITLLDGKVRKVTVTVLGEARTKAERERQIRLVEEREHMSPGEDPLLNGLSSYPHMGTWYYISYRSPGGAPVADKPRVLVRGKISGRPAYVIAPGGVVIGSAEGDYSKVEIDWGRWGKVSPDLISIPGVDRKFYAAVYPRKAVTTDVVVSLYDQQGGKVQGNMHSGRVR